MKSALAFALILACSTLAHSRDKSNSYQLGIYIAANAVADNTSTDTTRCNTDVGAAVCSGGVRFNQVIIYQIQVPDGVWHLETYRQAEDSMARSNLGFEPTHLKSEKANPLDLLKNGDKVLFRVEEHRKLLGVETDILIPFADNPNKEAKFVGTFVSAVVPEQAKPPSDNVRAMCDAHKLSPDLEKQLCKQSDGSAPGPPPGNAAVAPYPAARNGVLLFAYRTHAHVRYNKPEEFTSIVDDVISFLKTNGVPVVNDLIHASVVTDQKTASNTLVTYLRQIGAQRLLFLAVDTPFTAKLELILQCYDSEGKLLWEEKIRENPRQSVAAVQATEELHKRLGLRMQELHANEPHNSTPLTVTPPVAVALAAVAPDTATRKSYAENTRQRVIKQLGDKVLPGFNITADAPDASIYVYHSSGTSYPDCSSMLTNEGFVSNLRSLGFAQLVCTDDGNTRFTFDLIAQKQPQTDQRQQAELAQRKLYANSIVDGIAGLFPNASVKVTNTVVAFYDDNANSTMCSIVKSGRTVLQTVGTTAITVSSRTGEVCRYDLTQ
jgi:hypothetical protein